MVRVLTTRAHSGHRTWRNGAGSDDPGPLGPPHLAEWCGFSRPGPTRATALGGMVRVLTTRAHSGHRTWRNGAGSHDPGPLGPPHLAEWCGFSRPVTTRATALGGMVRVLTSRGNVGHRTRRRRARIGGDGHGAWAFQPREVLEPPAEDAQHGDRLGAGTTLAGHADVVTTALRLTSAYGLRSVDVDVTVARSASGPDARQRWHVPSGSPSLLADAHGIRVLAAGRSSRIWRQAPCRFRQPACQRAAVGCCPARPPGAGAPQHTDVKA